MSRVELSTLYAQQPTMAVQLADRVVNENLTVTAIRNLVRNAMQPEPKVGCTRDILHNCRANAKVV